MPSCPTTSYPSDLTNAQWNYIRYLFPPAKSAGRPRTINIRSVVNAIFYLNRTGCAWRYLPACFPSWKTVYWYYTIWRKLGIWKKIHDNLVRRVRCSSSKRALPTCTIIDSQSVRTAMGENRGYDGFKRLNGRKRHIMVDTLGLIHSINVHAANEADCKFGHKLYNNCSRHQLKRLKVIYADLGYQGTFETETHSRLGIWPTLPPCNPNSGQGIKKKWYEKRGRVLRGLPKKRWIIERTFAWFNFFRRLARDHERKIKNSVAMIQIAMIQLLLRPLHRNPAVWLKK